MVIAHAGGLPAEGDEVTVPLPADPAELLQPGDPPVRTLEIEVRDVERRFPASVFVTVTTKAVVGGV